jgi:hypothetical protein
MADYETFGYEVRKPFQSELKYFKKNPHVSGMAAADNRIILNPYSKLAPEQQGAVAKNEAIRLFMRGKKYNYDFDVTPEQLKSFQGTEYAKPENVQSLKDTLVSRIITGDPSAGKFTPAQKKWADTILGDIKNRNRFYVK